MTRNMNNTANNKSFQNRSPTTQRKQTDMRVLASRKYKVGVIIMDPTCKYTVLVKQKSTGNWWFPKGSLESFNTILEAKREVLEETGLDIIIDKNTQTMEFKDVSFTIYIITHEICNVIPKDTNEIEDVKWVHVDDIKNYKTNNVFNLIWMNASVFIYKDERIIQKQRIQLYKTVCNECKKASVLYIDQKEKYEELQSKYKSQLRTLKKIINITEILKKENDKLKENVNLERSDSVSDDESIMTLDEDLLTVL